MKWLLRFSRAISSRRFGTLVGVASRWQEFLKIARAIIAKLRADGACWCGGSVWQGQTAMRISVSNWTTTDEDVDRCVDAMVRVANRVKAG
jgi:hypothetical protein